jgi:hypothetical protein
VEGDRLGRRRAAIGLPAGQGEVGLGVSRALEREAAPAFGEIRLHRTGVVEHRRHEQELLVVAYPGERPESARVDERAQVVLDDHRRVRLPARGQRVARHLRVRDLQPVLVDGGLPARAAPDPERDK